MDERARTRDDSENVLCCVWPFVRVHSCVRLCVSAQGIRAPAFIYRPAIAGAYYVHGYNLHTCTRRAHTHTFTRNLSQMRIDGRTTFLSLRARACVLAIRSTFDYHSFLVLFRYCAGIMVVVYSTRDAARMRACVCDNPLQMNVNDSRRVSHLSQNFRPRHLSRTRVLAPCRLVDHRHRHTLYLAGAH